MMSPPSLHPTTRASQVVIVGAGPSGCLLALLLSAQNLRVTLFDFRPDPRLQPSPQKRTRSINLAISTRGLTALSLAGLSEDVRSAATPMHGRCIHSSQSGAPLQFHRYGQPGQYLLSVSRARLNALLLDACDAVPGITMEFGARCTGVDLDAPRVFFEKGGESFVVDAELVVGADGAFSAVRAEMARRPGFDFSQSYVNAAYKELAMINIFEGRQMFPEQWLHIWPRHRFMLIALPNGTGSFTATLFMDKHEMMGLDDRDKVEAFFKANFPDALAVMPSLAIDYANNPTPPLVTIRCQPYNYEDKAVIIGDAAHAIVPFYGQGCNAAFEDCRLLAESIQRHTWANRKEALDSYAKARKENADAIADLALDHYDDMSSRSANLFFVMKRRMEIFANRMLPSSFLPLYSMVTFSNIPYAEAVRRAMVQDRRLEYFLLSMSGLGFLTAATIAVRNTWKRSS